MKELNESSGDALGLDEVSGINVLAARVYWEEDLRISLTNLSEAVLEEREACAALCEQLRREEGYGLDAMYFAKRIRERK